MKRAFFIFFMAVSDLIAVAFFFNFAAGSITAFNDKLEPAAIFYHGNHYGYFLVMVIAVAAGCFINYKGKMAVISAVSLIISLGALALNRSMGGILAAGTVLIIMTIISAVGKGDEGRRALIMLAAMLLAAAAALALIRPLREDIMQMAAEFMQIVSGDNNIYAGNGRWGIWQYVAEYIADYPIWGYGCEGIADIMKSYTLTTSPHNEPLTYAAFFGIPAAVLYCAGVITAVIKGIRNGRHDPDSRIAAYAAMGYFISSIFGLAFFYTTPFEFVFLGLASQRINYSKFE
jgi:O-antigen ligase